MDPEDPIVNTVSSPALVQSPRDGRLRSRGTAVGGLETGVPYLVVASAAAPAASPDWVASGHLQRWPRNRVFYAGLPAANVGGH